MPAAEMDRMMKVQEMILKATAGKLTWWEAAEILGVTDRTMRRWRIGWHGYDGRKVSADNNYFGRTRLASGPYWISIALQLGELTLTLSFR